MKIGLIITPYKEDEKEKDEYVPIDSSRPWLKNVDEEFIIHHKNKQYVADDIAIYYYLKYKKIKNRERIYRIFFIFLFQNINLLM